MKGLKLVFCFGLGMAVFLGSIHSLNPAGKTESATDKISFASVEIPDQIKEKITNALDLANPLLLNTIKLLPDLNKDQFEFAKPIIISAFSKTYLRDPKFIPEGGKAIEGWDKILPVLKEMAAKKKGMDVPITGIEVCGEFLAYDLQRQPSLEEDVDLTVTIRTHIDLGSNDVIEGTAAHRRLCEL